MLSRFYQVSIDYIAGLTNEKKGLNKSNLSDYETELLLKLKKLDDIDKGRVLGTVDALISQKNERLADRAQKKPDLLRTKLITVT